MESLTASHTRLPLMMTLMFTLTEVACLDGNRGSVGKMDNSSSENEYFGERGLAQPIDQDMCLTRGRLLALREFQEETCFGCYIYMPANQFKPGQKWKPSPTQKNQLTNGTMQVIANHTDISIPLLDSFASEENSILWKDCCSAAMRCCRTMLAFKGTAAQLDPQQNDEKGAIGQPSAVEDVTEQNTGSRWGIATYYGPKKDGVKGPRCPPTWDGWQCWKNGGTPGVVEEEVCPSYIYFHTTSSSGRKNDFEEDQTFKACQKNAQKTCTKAGQWYRRQHADGKIGEEWTDFTTCSKVKDLMDQEHVHIALYAISIAALMPALFIFFSYKALRVVRIALHKNLFASLLLNSISMIIFKKVVILSYTDKAGPNSLPLLLQNTVGCRWLLMQSKYFRLSNYTWMFCEGYYLHHLLANTFAQERGLLFIVLIGWGLPLLPCLAYAVLRLTLDDTMCWALPSEAVWVEGVYMVPGLLCILINAAFFANIFRILVTKLQAPPANEPANYRKAVRATVLLLPLFGLHWLLTLYRPQSDDCFWLFSYKYINIIFDGLQGLIVSAAFCYSNGEIKHLIRQTYVRARDHLVPERFVSTNRMNNLQLSEINRKPSDTCLTQVASGVGNDNRNGSSRNSVRNFNSRRGSGERADGLVDRETGNEQTNKLLV